MNTQILAGAAVGTFVVDSNAALATWANNTPGYDFTSVFVKSGTWTSDKRVDFEETGTKAVIGEGGSVLAFTCAHGVGYNFETYGVNYLSRDYFIVGITIHMINGGIAFNSCANITGCHAKSNRGRYSMAYFECRNVNNCSAESFMMGFDNTHYLTSCYAKNCDYGYNEIYLLCNCIAENCTEKYRYGENLVNCI